MATKKSSKKLSVSRAGQKAEAMFSAEATNFHGVPALPGQMIDSGLMNAEWWAVGDCRSIFEKLRKLGDENDFVGSWVQTRRIFFDDGLRLEGQNEVVEAWLDDKGRRVMPWLRGINGAIWERFLLQDNVVVFWIATRGSRLPSVEVLPCEVCDYRRTVGGEILKIKMPKQLLTSEEKGRMIRDFGAARGKDWIDAYEKGKVLVVDPDFGEHFKVLRRSTSGPGLCMPRLRQALPLLGTRHVLQRADWAGADQHNNVIQQVQVGEQMRFAEALNQPAMFRITSKLKAQMEKELKPMKGSFRAITDYIVNWMWKYLDPKFFDPTKYHGTQTMLDRWGGAGMLLLSTGNPWLVPFFRQEGMFDRGLVAGLLNELLDDRDFLPMKPPAPLRVGWNPNTFDDIKMLLEKLRFATGSGIMSWETAREQLQLDNDTEAERLKAEGQDRESCQPPFEPKQGQLTNGAGGRPAEGPGGGRKEDAK